MKFKENSAYSHALKDFRQLLNRLSLYLKYALKKSSYFSEICFHGYHSKVGCIFFLLGWWMWPSWFVFVSLCKGDNCCSHYCLYLGPLKRRVRIQKKRNNHPVKWIISVLWPLHSDLFIPHYLGSMCLKERRKKKEKADRTNEVKHLKSFLSLLVLLSRLSSKKRTDHAKF